MNVLKKYFVLMTLVVMALQLVTFRVASAASFGSVVINEIAWAGTSDNSNDEWIELYNNTNQSIDLTGWVIEDDGVSFYTIASGTIAPRGYFLIEDTEDTIGNVSADAVIGISLANAGDSLVLKDADGSVIDTVNGLGGAWYAGDGTSKATMERIEPSITVDSVSNWSSATSGNGSVGRTGSPILGTPRGANSNFSGGTKALFTSAKTDFSQGENFSVGFKVEKVVDLYAYGVEINYNPSLLRFVSADESNFLKGDGSQTSFNYGLEDDTQGKLIVANARLQNPPSGVDGTAELFSVDFEVIGSNGQGDISVGGASFLAGTDGDIEASFSPLSITVGDAVELSGVRNLQSNTGESVYSLALNWTAPESGAEKYVVKRKASNGNFMVLGETVNLSFVDKDGVINGGNIIPNIVYEYQIIPVKNGVLGPASAISASESRGLVGDSDRSGRVDGRDLESLARSYGSGFGDEEYNPLSDTNFDGIIDGSDLIDLGVNFGMKL
ncbi:MAG: lamin tail domain-containing protein [Candidatus Gracilibacteria bacterium]|nr:lamin tail domain-containing protein [Candidatus Gracilibacteria bacterium]